jgi:GntR family transcriptional regulator
MDFSSFRTRGTDRWPHQQIADTIEAAIDSGELRPGEPVPSEQRLMQETGAARGTVRRAMALLREKGKIYTIPQLGSFIAPRDGRPD